MGVLDEIKAISARLSSRLAGWLGLRLATMVKLFVHLRHCHLSECISIIEYGDIYNGSIYSDIFHEESNKYEKITLCLEH